MGRILFLCTILLLPLTVESQKKAIPYLGPGLDKLSPQKYLEVYSKYIKESISLGFPPDRCSQGSCEQALSYLFRITGLFDYPVPPSGEIKSWISPKKTRECYTHAGIVAQIQREQGGALDKLVIVYAKSPKAIKRLVRTCRKRNLDLQKDRDTGLERLAGVPVGYPHPYLCPNSQGLYVRQLTFHKDRNACRPTNYSDNAWVNGYILNEDRCQATQNDLLLTWQGKIDARRFAEREQNRQYKRSISIAMDNGASKKEAKKMGKILFDSPMGFEVSYTGMAMRNLEACNRLGIGNQKGSTILRAPASSGLPPKKGQ